MPCSTSAKLSFLDVNHIYIGSDKVEFTNTAKNLGVLLDKELSMENHLNLLSRTCYLELRKIGQFRHYLDTNATKTLTSAFILSRLDYCNSLFAGLPGDKIQKLQRIQNNAARLVLKKSKREHITPLLKELHWLPVKARIDYKLAVMCFKALKTNFPSYITDLLVPYHPTRSLRSSNSNLLSTPRVQLKKYGERAFTFSGPSIWNSLPIELRLITNLNTFKRHLKAHLFREYYCSVLPL